MGHLVHSMLELIQVISRSTSGRDPYDKLTLNSKARRSVHSSSIIGRARCPHLTCSKD